MSNATVKSSLRRSSVIWDTAAQFTELNPVLDVAEIGLELDTGLFKFGNGRLSWNDLEYANKSIPPAPSDGYYLRRGGSWVKLADATQTLRFEEVTFTLEDGTTRTAKVLVAEDSDQS